MSPSPRHTNDVPAYPGAPGLPTSAGGEPMPVTSWAHSAGVVFFDPATDTSPYAAKHKKTKERRPAQKPSVTASARAAATRAARAHESPRPADTRSAGQPPAGSQQRGSLRIVPNDPIEIRRYAEAQRRSNAGVPPAPVARESSRAAGPAGFSTVPGGFSATGKAAAAQEPAGRERERTSVPDSSEPPEAPAAARMRQTIARHAASEHLWRTAMVWITAVACVFVTVAMLYFPAQELYLAVRQNERLTDELDQNLARNEQMQQRVVALQTAEGVQDEARLSYGLVMPGENAVTVVGIPQDDVSASTIPPEIRRGSGQNTSSWATDLLDRVFGVVGATGASVAEEGDVATVVEEEGPVADPSADIVAQGDEAPEQPAE